MNYTPNRRLSEFVTVQTNNDACVVLKVKPGSEMGLIEIGCFNGNETAFRLTKGGDQTCTVFSDGGKSYSWHWGDKGYTIVTEDMNQRGKMIQECIERDFKIRVTR